MIQRSITSYMACLLGMFMVGCATNKVRAPIEDLFYQQEQVPDSSINSSVAAVDDNSADVTTAVVNPATSVPVTVAPITTTTTNITNTTTATTSSAYWQAPFNPHGYKFTVVSGFGNGSKGVNIKGTKGSPILAAASGRVIYAGNGLKEYGNLIIIRHKDNAYLSAYGYNDTVLVKADDNVRQGQQIATMGLYKGTPLLHFEIRKNGIPIDPTILIPSLK